MPCKLRTVLAFCQSCASSCVFSISGKDVARKTVVCGKYEYHYLLYAPQRPAGNPYSHGAGDQPDPMVEAWKSRTRAERKTPVAIYIGDREQPDLYDQARKTRDLLRKENFPVHYVELRDHDHNY